LNGRTALVALATAAVLFLVYRLAFPPLSDEQQIERLLRWLERGFNRADAAACVRPLTPDFRETTEGLSRNEIRAALVYFFRENRLPKTREPGVRVILDPRSIEIDERDRDEVVYDVRCQVTFERAGDATLADVEIDLVCVPDRDRFVIRRASHRITSGRLF